MIRLADKWDIPQILDLLRLYRDEGIIHGVENITEEETPRRILTTILAGGGLAIVYEKDKQIVGMLLALKTPLLWDFNKFIMNEIAYFVRQEYRHSTVGYRLLKKYTDTCDDMVNNGDITRYTITQLEGQDLPYHKFGFVPIEHTWSS